MNIGLILLRSLNIKTIPIIFTLRLKMSMIKTFLECIEDVVLPMGRAILS